MIREHGYTFRGPTETVLSMRQLPLIFQYYPRLCAQELRILSRSAKALKASRPIHAVESAIRSCRDSIAHFPPSRSTSRMRVKTSRHVPSKAV